VKRAEEPRLAPALADTRFELVSDQFARLFGYDSAQVQGLHTHVICPSDDAHLSFIEMATETFAAGGTCDEERELVRADSSRFWARLQGAPVRAGDASAGTIWIFTDITESRRHREQLSWSASHDELTRLANRRDLEARLSRTKVGDTLVMCDLDHFKALNDSQGHAAGDVVLRDFGHVLLGALRGDDYAARYGGEEFVLVLSETDSNQSVDVLVRLRRRWAEAHPEITFSAGYATHTGSMTVPELLEAADQAMYAAKSSGRDCFRGVETQRVA